MCNRGRWQAYFNKRVAGKGILNKCTYDAIKKLKNLSLSLLKDIKEWLIIIEKYKFIYVEKKIIRKAKKRNLQLTKYIKSWTILHQHCFLEWERVRAKQYCYLTYRFASTYVENLCNVKDNKNQTHRDFKRRAFLNTFFHA